MIKGIVSEIRSFSTQDGPGIRTTVFLKGCPLRCKWCSSPETWTSVSQIYFFEKKCQECGTCGKVCLENAITAGKGRIIRNKCNLCLRCVEACPQQALKKVGEELTVEEAAKQIQADRPFFKRSGGGMTVSGGEPLLQPDFVEGLMSLCQENKIPTCLDTCGYGDPEKIKRILKHTDLVLFSLKHMDPVKHKEWTGVSNEKILANARLISGLCQMRISLPVITGANDDIQNIKNTAEFAVSLGIKYIDVEPLHKLGQAKYEALGMDSPFSAFEEITEEKLLNIFQIIESYGLKTTRGRCIDQDS